jgi:hypothetical protein
MEKAVIIDKLLEAKSTLVKMSSIKTLNTRMSLLASLKQTIFSAVKDTKNREMRMYLTKIHNKTDSLIGGLSTQDYTLNDLLLFRKAAFNRVIALIEKEKVSPSDKIKKLTAEEEAEADLENDSGDLDLPDEGSPEALRKLAAIMKGDLINEETIKKYSNEARSLNDLISKKFIFARKPIIPIINPPVLPEVLARAGFKIDKIGFYPILRNQLVLGINTRYAIQIKLSMKKNVQQIAEHLVQLLSKRAGKYHIMGPSYKHSTGYYFWLLSEREVNTLKKATGKFSMVIKKWGMAF